jgi:hypothetical protein
MENLHAQFEEKCIQLGGQLFDDPEFPPEKNSLIRPANASKKPGFEKGVEWTRATEIEALAGDELELYKDGIEPSDI